LGNKKEKERVERYILSCPKLGYCVGVITIISLILLHSLDSIIWYQYPPIALETVGP